MIPLLLKNFTPRSTSQSALHSNGCLQPIYIVQSQVSQLSSIATRFPCIAQQCIAATLHLMEKLPAFLSSLSFLLGLKPINKNDWKNLFSDFNYRVPSVLMMIRAQVVCIMLKAELLRLQLRQVVRETFKEKLQQTSSGRVRQRWKRSFPETPFDFGDQHPSVFKNWRLANWRFVQGSIGVIVRVCVNRIKFQLETK